MDDADLRGRLVAAGKERLGDFAPAKIEARLWEILGRNGITPQS